MRDWPERLPCPPSRSVPWVRVALRSVQCEEVSTRAQILLGAVMATSILAAFAVLPGESLLHSSVALYGNHACGHDMCYHLPEQCARDSMSTHLWHGIQLSPTNLWHHAHAGTDMVGMKNTLTGVWAQHYYNHHVSWVLSRREVVLLRAKAPERMVVAATVTAGIDVDSVDQPSGHQSCYMTQSCEHECHATHGWELRSMRRMHAFKDLP